ncbi:MAG: hypothetical protein ACREQ9_06490 [Candidatus Binatia bacterium]
MASDADARHLPAKTGIGATGLLFGLVAISVGPITPLLEGRGAGFSPYRAEDSLRAELADAHAVILNDIRRAGDSRDAVAAVLGAFPEVRTGTSSDRVRFVSDVDSDGDSELITYELSRGYVLRTVQHRRPGGWSVEMPVAVLARVRAFTVRFLDQRRTPLSAEALRRHLPHTIRLTMTAAGEGQGGEFEVSFRGETSTAAPSA